MAIVVSCSSFSDDPSTARTADAGIPDAALAPVDAAPLHAGDVDACTPLIDDDFTGTELGADWIVAGNRPTIDDGEVVLVDSTRSAANSIWHRASAPKGSTLRIEVELHVSPIAGVTADGIAIAWAPAKADDADGGFLTTPGGSAANLAICPGVLDAAAGPFDAIALAVQTYSRRLALLDESDLTTCATAIHDVTLAETMPAVLEIRNDVLTGSLVGTVATSLPRAMDVAWVGFGAGSGGLVTSREAIAHVHVSSCP